MRQRNDFVCKSGGTGFKKYIRVKKYETRANSNKWAIGVAEKYSDMYSVINVNSVGLADHDDIGVVRATWWVTFRDPQIDNLE